MENPPPTPEPIAIIGMACKFAGASDPLELLDLIRDVKSARSEIPERSFKGSAWYHPDRDRRGAVRNHFQMSI